MGNDGEGVVVCSFGSDFGYGVMCLFGVFFKEISCWLYWVVGVGGLGCGFVVVWGYFMGEL